VTLRNYAKKALSAAEIRGILAATTSPADVLNTRHKTARAAGWHERAPSKRAFLEAAVLENNLLRRPLVLRAGALAVGNDADGIRALLRDT